MKSFFQFIGIKRLIIKAFVTETKTTYRISHRFDYLWKNRENDSACFTHVSLDKLCYWIENNTVLNRHLLKSKQNNRWRIDFTCQSQMIKTNRVFVQCALWSTFSFLINKKCNMFREQESISHLVDFIRQKKKHTVSSFLQFDKISSRDTYLIKIDHNHHWRIHSSVICDISIWKYTKKNTITRITPLILMPREILDYQ